MTSHIFETQLGTWSYSTSFPIFDPSRRQQADFLRRELEGEKVEKSESEGNLRGIEDVKSVREHVGKNLVEIDEAGGAGWLKIWKTSSRGIGLLKNKHGA